MYARVVTVQAQPGKTEEAIAIFRNSFIPAAKHPDESAVFNEGMTGFSSNIERPSDKSRRLQTQ